MKAALFSRAPYLGPAPRGVWPVPAQPYDSAVAEQSMAHCLEQFRLADELGFDWVTVAEHHYAPFSMSPNPMVLAGALSQCVRRARIALLGATILRLAGSCGARISFCGTTSLRTCADIPPRCGGEGEPPRKSPAGSPSSVRGRGGRGDRGACERGAIRRSRAPAHPGGCAAQAGAVA